MPAKKIFIFLLLLIGLLAAAVLVRQRQDIRERAFWYYRPVRPTPASSWSESYRVVETIPLVTDGARQEKPAIWGNKVIWMDWRVRNAALYLYDLDSRRETGLAVGEVYNIFDPDISGSWITFLANPWRYFFTVYAYNLDTGQLRQLKSGDVSDDCLFGNTTCFSPAVYNQLVVWAEHSISGRGAKVKLADLTSGQLTTIYNDANANTDWVKIFGDTIAWSNYQQIVYYHNLVSHEQRKLVGDDGLRHWRPDVSADFIVWQDSRAGRGIGGQYGFTVVYYDIYGFDLDRQQEFVISQGNTDHLYPRVHDRLVVWQDNRAGNWDIYAYDLATCREFSVASGGHDEVRPAVYGDWVVWEDFRHDYDHTQYNSDIYAARVSLPDLNVTSALVAEPCPSRSAFVVPLPTPTATVAPAATATPTLTVTPWPTATLTPPSSPTPPIIAPSLQPTPITALSDLTVAIENLGIFDRARRRVITPTPQRPIRVGEIVVFDVRGRETAGVRVTNSFITRVELYRGDQLLGSYEYYSAGLYASSNFAFRVDWSKIPALGSPTSGISPAGNYRLRVRIDSQSALVERSEVNNEVEREFVVQ